jgi:hypothetical protein
MDLSDARPAGGFLSFRRNSVGILTLNRLSVEAAAPTALENATGELSMIDGISAVTLGTHEMPRAFRF